MEGQIDKHNQSIGTKIPDIEKALDSIALLENKGEGKMEVEYMVSNNLWGTANVNVNNKVLMWLGADVMCEYTLGEAKKLLETNLSNAQTTKKRNVSV